MRTVREVSELAGVSVRTLHHYDAIGLLRPSERSAAGYRLYSDDDLLRLQQILLFRELEFPLADIRRIVDAPDFDRDRALAQQIELLELRRERLEGIIAQARALMEKGTTMGFDAFDTSKLDEYQARAKAAWGDTDAWAEYERKGAGRTKREEASMGAQLMDLFVPFGRMAAEGADPAGEDAQAQVARIRAFITEHMYTCTNEILAGLGKAYGAGGEFTSNINAAAGEGAAEFAAQAVAAYCA